MSNLAFFEAIAETGIDDAAIGFYMALPGTQLFDSLYDAGKIHIDRTYFRHILSSTSLWATSSYSGLSRTKLTRWKFKLLRHFYSQQRQQVDSAGLGSTVRQAIKGLRGDGSDETKLQSAFRNGVISTIGTLKVQPAGLDAPQRGAPFLRWAGRDLPRHPPPRRRARRWRSLPTRRSCTSGTSRS